MGLWAHYTELDVPPALDLDWVPLHRFQWEKDGGGGQLRTKAFVLSKDFSVTFCCYTNILFLIDCSSLSFLIYFIIVVTIIIIIIVETGSWYVCQARLKLNTLSATECWDQGCSSLYSAHHWILTSASLPRGSVTESGCVVSWAVLTFCPKSTLNTIF